MKRVLSHKTKGAIAAMLAAALLAGCGGGGGSSATPPVSHGTSQSSKVKLTITIPGKNGTNVKGRTRYYTARSTQGIGIDWATAPASGGTFGSNTPNTTPMFGDDINAGYASSNTTCGSAATDGSFSCTIYIPGVPVGYNDFKITLWDSNPSTAPCSAAALGGSGCSMSGSALSTAIVSAQVTLQNQAPITTSLTANSSATDTTFSVGATTGMQNGDTIQIGSGAAEESLTIQSTTASTITTTAGAASPHSSGDPVIDTTRSTNLISLTTLPIVQNVTVNLINAPYFVDGTPAGPVTVSVDATDADGNLIVGSDQLVDANGNNLSITLASSSAHVTLASTGPFTTGSGALAGTTLNYDGSDMTSATPSLVDVVSASVGAAVINGLTNAYNIDFTKSNGTIGVPGVPQFFDGYCGAPTAPCTRSQLSAAPTAIVAQSILPGGGTPDEFDVLAGGTITNVEDDAGISTQSVWAVPGNVTAIAAGKDGYLWYADNTAGAAKIGKFDPTQASPTFTESNAFALTPSTGLIGAMTAAPDGQIYAVSKGEGTAAVYVVNPQTMTGSFDHQLIGTDGTGIASGYLFNAGADPTVCWAATGSPLGVVACFDLNSPATPGICESTASEPNAVVVGPDHYLYVAETGEIEVFQQTGPSGCGPGSFAVLYTYTLAHADEKVTSMTLGNDGAIWFTMQGGAGDNFLGRINPGSGAQGTLAEYGAATGLPASASLTGIAADPNGSSQLWLTDGSSNNAVYGVQP